MTLVIDQKVLEEVKRRVQEALDRHQPVGYRISVAEEGILEEDQWYTVVVESEGNRRTNDFYDALADAEAELEDVGGKHVLLVPVIGE